jgi:hypothetical protein
VNPEEIPPAYIERVAQVESRGNDLAKGIGSSALGRFQFVKGTWEGLRRENPQLALTASGRTDRAQAERAFRVFTATNARAFRAGMGREPDFAELYLAHFLGSGGAVAACAAHPATPAAEVLGSAVGRANPGARGMTCGDLRKWAAKKMQVPSPALPPAGKPPKLSTTDLNDESLRRARGEGQQ